ncbi:MAG: hypothetical protein JWM58_4501 [Rhizobium sp.]|nr:hypothetical protein [Rhizobium sp.]
MDASNNTTPEKDREEDFRDYDQRNNGEGWPYADGEPVKKRNAAYGDTSDELDPTNIEVASDTFIESEGGPTLFPDEEHGNINDDGIEEEIANKLSESGRWDDTQIEVTVHNGIAEINGQVETEHDRQLINQIALRTAGIRDTRNKLILIGVDSHIPSDADE